MMATPLTVADRNRLAKLLGMTGSDEDGEALNAVRLANRLVKDRGITWGDVLTSTAAGDSPPSEPHRQEQSKPWHPSWTAYRKPEPAARAGDHIALARDLERRGRDCLTAWERDFLVGVRAYRTLKPKQREQLENIKRKVSMYAQAA